MIKDSYRTVQKCGSETAIVATFPARKVADANGIVRELAPAVSVHTFKPLATAHPLASICPNTKMSSFTVAAKDSNFLPTRYDYLVPVAELQAFLSSAYVVSDTFAIQVVKRMSDSFLIQLQAYATAHPNFVASNQKSKETAIQFLSALPIEPAIEVAQLPVSTTKEATTPSVVVPSNVSSMSNEELLALLQNPSAS